MKARLLVDRRLVLAENAFAELVVWEVPEPVNASTHHFKYRLALVVEGTCVLRYDNEAGKGDHLHRSDTEAPYRFIDVNHLIEDFMAQVRRTLDEDRRS